MAFKTEKVSVATMIEENKRKNRYKQGLVEKSVPVFLFIMAIISVLTTIGIVFTLLLETITFFERVNIIEFITSKEWFPFFEADPQYGIIPLIAGTLKVTFIAVIVAVPIGLATAIYLSEYASDTVRKVIKPILEVLAGIPTIVYGFFALTFVTPLLQKIVPDLNIFNALSPGIVVGIMIIPMIASLSEDAMGSVPSSIREGALAMGSTKLEVVIKSGIACSFIRYYCFVCTCHFSRNWRNDDCYDRRWFNTESDFDVTESIQTMTAYIVQVSLGDAGYGSTIYYSIYAVGMTLFIFTLIMNFIAQFISKHFREEY